MRTPPCGTNTPTTNANANANASTSTDREQLTLNLPLEPEAFRLRPLIRLAQRGVLERDGVVVGGKDAQGGVACAQLFGHVG